MSFSIFKFKLYSEECNFFFFYDPTSLWLKILSCINKGDLSIYVSIYLDIYLDTDIPFSKHRKTYCCIN